MISLNIIIRCCWQTFFFLPSLFLVAIVLPFHGFEFQQYADELADSIKYAQDRGLEPCNNFHKFVCSGVHKHSFKEVLATKRWSDVSHQAINQAAMIDHLAEMLDRQQQQKASNASPSNNWVWAKCVHRQMLPFYAKCTAADNTPIGGQIGLELKTALDQNAAKLFGGDGDGKRKGADAVGVGFGGGRRNDRLLLNEAGIVAAFPFIPFFTIQRVAYGKGERMVLLAKGSSLFLAPACSSHLGDQKMHAILRHLHQMGIFDNFENADEMDAVFAEFAAINRHLAIKFTKTTSSSMQFPIRMFQLLYTPSIDWTHILNKLLEKYGGGGNNNEKRLAIQQASSIVIIKRPSFFSAVTKLIDEFTRTGSSKNGNNNNIRRRAMFEYMRLSPFWHLLGEIGDSQLNGLLASLGTRPITRSPTNCIDHYLRKYFPHCLENAFAKNRREEFDGEPAAAASSKTDKLQFFESFRQGFVDFLGTAGSISKWMPSAMRARAIHKLRGLRARFGLGLSAQSEASSIDKFYEHFKRIGANTSWLKMLLDSEEMSAFWPPSNFFGLKSTTVEYEQTTNSVFIGPAFWQKPWWWSKQEQPEDGGQVESRDDDNDNENNDDEDVGRRQQKASTTASALDFSLSMLSSKNILSPLNYGSAGHVIAHELAHSLDPNNVWRDASGKIAIIRDAAMYLQKRKYNSQLRCLQRQYANYWIKKERKNSQKTLNEDFADNVGLHVAYSVFKADLLKRMSRTKGQQNEQNNSKIIAATADGLERFSEEQLFFIAFAFKQCRKYTKPGRRLSKELVDRKHSFPSARINLPLINLTPFANAFKCSIGTRMNPAPMQVPKNDEKEKNRSVFVGLKCPFA